MDIKDILSPDGDKFWVLLFILLFAGIPMVLFGVVLLLIISKMTTALYILLLIVSVLGMILTFAGSFGLIYALTRYKQVPLNGNRQSLTEFQLVP